MNIELTLKEELNLSLNQVNTVINLIKDGNTIPFIARYRKEATGNLSDITLRDFEERYNYLLSFQARLDTIIASLKEQDVYSQDLENALNNAKTLSELEDIYLPYRPKRKTRASEAKKKGLEPLAEVIYKGIHKDDFISYVNSFVSDKENAPHNSEEALLGAKDIIAEWVSEDASNRKYLRNVFQKEGIIKSEMIKENHKYEMYYDYSEAVYRIPSHRVLAINRAEKEGFLRVKISIDEDKVISYLKNRHLKNKEYEIYITEAIADSLKRLLYPSLENEIRAELKDKAEDGALNIFKANLKELLLEAPIRDKVVLGFDPAFRTGCKLAVVDPFGNVLYTGVIYPTAPQNKEEESAKIIRDLIKKYHINLISLGNGTASRESEAFLKKAIDGLDVDYVITDESGASVYSASPLASVEFPQYDVALRSAVSMARRIQDPLCELVKIPPKSMGVGQYQHDMNQKRLEETLNNVVEDAVNKVGVSLNSASKSLLSYVSGISSSLADNILQYREENGAFVSRLDLKKVKKLGPKAFEQCAGFLRIEDGKEPFDNTGIHPENYLKARQLLKKLNLKEADLGTSTLNEALANVNIASLAHDLDLGEPTLKDIIEEMKKPGRDIRDLSKKAILRHDVTDISMLQVGMVLQGTVRNIMDFGVFVDIGVHVDGLIHISELSTKRVNHPLDIVHLHEIVKVKVIQIDLVRKRIGLSLKQV